MAEQQIKHSPHSGLKKGLYLIPTAFTAANVAMGFFAVLSALRGFQIVASDPVSASHYFDYGAIAIGFAILFDTLDGRLARMTRTATEIGVQLDSLADVLTFGIAPIVLGYTWAVGVSYAEGTSLHGLGVFVLFMYLMCGAFRLARFNLQATRPRVLIEGTPKVDKKHFVGLPIPVAAGLIAAIIHFTPMPLSSYGENSSHFYSLLMMALFGVLGVLMVSTLRYTSFKEFGTGRFRLSAVLIVAGFGMLLWLYSQYLLLFLTIGYVSHGLIFYVLNLLNPRKKQEPADAASEIPVETRIQ